MSIKYIIVGSSVKTESEPRKQTWKAKLKEIYVNIDELERYDAMYNIVERLGFKDIHELWKANPLIGGSTNPKDFGLAE